jgi:diacylglycerol kinase family enzyme
MQTVEREQKQRLGLAAYLLNGFLNLTGIRRHRFHLKVDGVEYQVRASEIMVGNSSLVGFRRVPAHLEILPDDGVVDVIIARALTLWDWLLLVVNFVLGIESNRPRFRILNAREQIIVTSDSPLVVQADGDVIGFTPVELTVLPKAVQVIVPGSGRNLVTEFLRRTGLARDTASDFQK